MHILTKYLNIIFIFSLKFIERNKKIKPFESDHIGVMEKAENEGKPCRKFDGEKLDQNKNDDQKPAEQNAQCVEARKLKKKIKIV